MIKYKSRLYEARELGELFGKLLTLAYLQELLRRAKLIVIAYKNGAERHQVWL